MAGPEQNVLLVIDDRELTAEAVRGIVGTRRYGDIIFRRQALIEHLRASLPAWARRCMVHVRSAEDLPPLRATLEACSAEASVCVIAARAGFTQPERLRQLVERLPYAEEDFTDRPYKPLLVFLHNAHRLVADWPAFEAAPLHTWEQAWHDSQTVQSVQPLDLARIRDLLSFTAGSTAARHFNEVSADAYYYTKSSADTRKMRAEFAFYGLAPAAMQPWLVQPFDFQERDGRASYRMMRYYLADAALQWVHGAFDEESFDAFIDRLLFFIAQRPRRACGKAESAAMARALFIDKLEQRIEQFLALPEGQRINTLAASATPALDVRQQLARFQRLYARRESGFICDHLAVGHGDPCFSNILYDASRHLLQLIDPKGALNEDELWTHPLYDICKVSHSVLGDYDFINNGQYSVGFDDANALLLHIRHSNHGRLKNQFLRQLRALNHDPAIVRLGEASLFLSMLALHIDVPNKAIAFMLKAHHILDEVEFERI
jgi:hypothetical protein